MLDKEKYRSVAPTRIIYSFLYCSSNINLYKIFQPNHHTELRNSKDKLNFEIV